MNPLAKILRVICGIWMIAVAGIMAVMPLLTVHQENYEDVKYTGVYYIKKLFEDGLGHFGGGLTQGQIAIVFLLLALPSLLGIVFGVAGIFGSRRQIVEGIGCFVVAALYLILLNRCHVLFPEQLNEAQVIEEGEVLKALKWLIGVYFLFGILIFATAFKKPKKAPEKNRIPDIAEIKQEQIQPRYEFIDEAEEKNRAAKDPNTGQGMSGNGQEVSRIWDRERPEMDRTDAEVSQIWDRERPGTDRMDAEVSRIWDRECLETPEGAEASW